MNAADADRSPPADRSDSVPPVMQRWTGGLAFIALFTACSDGQTGETDAGVHCGPGTVQ